MRRPRVTVYNEISIDGRVTGFRNHPYAYYALGRRRPCDAILMGSVTAQAFGPAETAQEYGGVGPSVPPAPPPPGFEDLTAEPRPLLVVPDSRGSVRCWSHARAQPWYGGLLTWLTAATPSEHRDHVRRRGVDHTVTGTDRVDLAAGLASLATDHGIATVRTDGGGSLNGALLAAGLVDEIVLLVTPSAAGSDGAVPLLRPPLPWPDTGVDLRLTECERLPDDLVWLSYEVV